MLANARRAALRQLASRGEHSATASVEVTTDAPWFVNLELLEIQGGNTMVRKATTVFLCAAAALFISAHAAFAQQQARLPKLRPFLTRTPDPHAAAATRAALDKNKGNGNLATFNYTVISSRDG